MDRLQALLNGRKANIRDPVSVSKVNHATERARLNNEDRKYNQIVYDNSLKQANLYNQSVMPNTGRDIGVGFKINVYIIKLSQLLGNKGELDKILRNYFTKGVSIQKLRGTTKESQVASSFFQKGEIVSTYNELMLYIKTYANDIISDDAFKAQMFNSSFNPLTQLLNDTAGLYPAFFASLPPPSNANTPQENTSERKIYETARDQCIGCYSTFNTMAQFIQNLIFRPIVKEDVSEYIKDNNVRSIFQTNPMAPAPIIIPQQEQQQLQPLPASPPLQPLQPPASPPLQPLQPLPVLDPNNPDQIREIMNAFVMKKKRYLYDEKEAREAYNFSKQNYEPITTEQEKQLVKNIKQLMNQIKQQKNIDSKQKAKDEFTADQAGQAGPAPVSPQAGPAPASPQQAPQQAPKISALRDGNPEILTEPQVVNEIFGILTNKQPYSNLDPQDQGNLRAVVRDTMAKIKQLENQKQGIYRAKDDTDIDSIINTQAQQTTKDLNTIFPNVGERIQFYRDLITAIKEYRIKYADNEAKIRQDDTLKGQQDTLWGLGKERNNNLVMNHILDFENMARRQARDGDLDTILELLPQLKGNENQIKMFIEKLRRERDSEPNMWGKGKHENKQGIIQRASMLKPLMEFEPKAEALKKGIVMSGGCSTCCMRGGMTNKEWNYAGYGEVMNEEDTPFKRMIGGMPNPFAPSIENEKYGKFLPYNASFDNEDDRDYFNEILPIEQGHYAELEKPVDLDEQADHIRKNNENYKVLTGKMKNVKYKN